MLVDTTCGSVLNVWKNVHNYARDGFTAVIHGKHYHEETKATASQALTHAGGQLPLRARPSTRRSSSATSSAATVGGATLIVARFAPRRQPGLRSRARPRRRIGLANQTTMLMSESLEIQEMLRARDARALRRRGARRALPRLRHDLLGDPGPPGRGAQACSTQGGLDVMVVIGGYNSSNTQALARICAARLPTYHIDGPDCLEGATPCATGRSARHDEASARGWLPAGPVRVGLTAGASTPNNVVGEVVERILALRGRTADELVGAA